MRIHSRNLINEWGPLFVISALSLFTELAAIRWVAGEVRIMAYFQNLVLMAAFLGLAIGFALVGRGKDYKGIFPWLWVFFVIVVLALGKRFQTLRVVYPGGGDEFIWESANLSFWVSLLIFIAVVAVIFFMTLFLFIPLGQATGEEMAKHKPIPAYITNIAASLCGVWLFSLLSFFNSPPVIWFTFALVGITVYLFTIYKFRWMTAIVFITTLIVIGIIEPKTVWSPYNRLDLSEQTVEQGTEKISLGYLLQVQHAYYQEAINLSEGFVTKIRNTFPSTFGLLKEYADGYNLPYLLSPAGSKVLIVGSGMGNDVAAALRAQMGEVVAVEIDPAILRLGQTYHPEKPYADPRVMTVIDDARSYFNQNRDKYDLVVFGLLDSHTLLSSMSSVRLDSYVYTIESFQQAKSHLNKDGIIVVTFSANDWIEERLGRMMQQVFNSGNIYFAKWKNYTTFVAGENLPVKPEIAQFAVWNSDPNYDNLPLATDNWPYIYLRSLRVPAGYWQTLLVIILLCVGLMARSFPEALKPDWHFWLLGAAFLLIEFKGITELALLFGTTWFVNSLAISGVLVMALFANIIVLKSKAINLRWIYFFLFASLIFGYFFPLSLLGGYNPLIKGLIGTTVLCLPLFFAGMIFSEALKRYGETSRPIASNFSGSAVGGILEYGSIWWGIKSLYLVALVLYVGALLAAIRQRLLSR